MKNHNLWCGLWLTLFIIGNAPVLAGPSATSHKGSSRWGANYFPNVPLITQDGKTVHFFDDLIKDKVVAINFIYTTCPDSCPLETARLAEVQRILGDRVGQDVFFYSITIDPDHDTPEVLKNYMELYQIGPGWTFLTGKESDIILLRKKLGLYIQEIQDGSNDHNLSLILGNQATGRWMKSSPFENPYVLAKQIGSWLHNWKLPSQKKLSYDLAPELRAMSKGESLFRTRCAACHTIGGGDTNQPEQRRVGPDLLGVLQMRDREWVTRWMMEPEKVLAEKDPIAMGLFAKYKIPMPNMRLNDLEATRIIEYLDKESKRVEKVREREAVASAKKSEDEPKSCCMKKKMLAQQEEKEIPTEDNTLVENEIEITVLNTNVEPAQIENETSLLSTSETLKVTASAIAALNDDEKAELMMLLNESAAPQAGRKSSTASMLFSSGLGCALLLLAAVFRRRSAISSEA